MRPSNLQIIRGVGSPIVVLVPHSGTVVPWEDRQDILLEEADLKSELLHMTDHFTDKLFVPLAHACGGSAVVNQVSRLVCDPERFRNDNEEPMSVKGMGAIYTMGSQNQPLRQSVTAEGREGVLKKYYDPYHDGMQSLVEECLEQFGKCLIVDGHSFPSKALPYEDPFLGRPEICLGTDSFHTSERLIDAVRAHFSKWFTVDMNTPFAGTIVPLSFLNRDPRVMSIMIEMRRDTYMDEEKGVQSKNFQKAADRVQSVADVLMKF